MPTAVTIVAPARRGGLAVPVAARGFTLIEMLVVVVIISVLMGLVIVGINAAIGDSKESQAATDIHQLKAAIESMKSSSRGQLPRDSFERYRLNAPDETNEGIETLIAVLRSTRFDGGPFLPFSEFGNRVGNTDGDESEEIYEEFGIDATRYDLFELVDPWGNPYVYVVLPNAETPARIYVDADGNDVEVKPLPLARTGQFPPDYMIWSFGPDMINNNGRGDDITSWEKSDEDRETDDDTPAEPMEP
jgi:general secretion pathway protein H